MQTMRAFPRQGPALQVVQSTLIVAALLALIVLRGPYRGLGAVMALTPMGMLAAFNLPGLGNTTIIAVDLAVLCLFTMLVFSPQGLPRMLGHFAPGTPGLTLALFLAYAAFATVFFPRVFIGQTEVYSIGRLAGGIGIVIRPLEPGTGNLSQLARMMLSVMAFALAATVIRRRPDPSLVVRGVMLATAVHVGFGLLDIATHATGTAWLLAPIRTANYALTLGQQMSGLNRMIGAFPEASAYGYFTLGMTGFWLSYWTTHRGSGGAPLVFLLLCVFVLLRGTSSSAYVAAAAFLTLFTLAQALRTGTAAMSGRMAWTFIVALALFPLLLAAGFTAYDTQPAVTDFIDRVLLDKLSSTSGAERARWNAQAWANFRDTWTLGTGLGSVRASNWLLALLASTGIAGTVLMLAFVHRLLRRQPPAGAGSTEIARVVLALKYGCAAFVIRAMVTKPTPNLEIIFFLFAGLIAGLTVSQAAQRGGLSLPFFRSRRGKPT